MKRLIHSMTLMMILTCIGSAAGVTPSLRQSQQSPFSPEETQQIDRFLSRSKSEKFKNLAGNALWSLIHNYSDKKQIDAVTARLQVFLPAFEQYRSGNPAPLKSVGGGKAFAEELVKWLESTEQSVRAFAATMLAIYGDTSYAARIADLIKNADQKNDLIANDRYAAAVALGALGAKEYTDTLAKMLYSKNEYDRAGAAIGLGWMQAKDKREVIAKLLKDESGMVRAAAKDALEMLDIKPEGAQSDLAHS